MLDVSTATRYIAVASPGTITDSEWLKRDPNHHLNPPVFNDYALMKVLYNLRRRSSAEQRIPVHAFQHTKPATPLDFSSLRDSDVIFIVGHGDPGGLYAMGPKATDGMDRLLDILTGDGNLERRRDGKKITILLLSCRAGLGFHKELARKLAKKLSIDVTVGGALGFTFGSIRDTITAHNEVLLRGIPWFMEYPRSITPAQAEKATSDREGKPITIAGKQTEIDQFKVDKKELEDQFTAVVKQLRSTEVNAALDEVNTRFRSEWSALLQMQFELYALAKKRSNLDFDMWFDRITEGYVWTDGRKVTDAEADALLTVDPQAIGDDYSSIR
jgi:hypothetical protein